MPPAAEGRHVHVRHHGRRGAAGRAHPSGRAPGDPGLHRMTLRHLAAHCSRLLQLRRIRKQPPQQDQKDSLTKSSALSVRAGQPDGAVAPDSPGCAGLSAGAEMPGRDRGGNDVQRRGSGEPDSHGWAGRGCGREPGNDRNRAGAGGGASVCSGGQPASRGDALHRHTGRGPDGAQEPAGRRAVGAREWSREEPADCRPATSRRPRRCPARRRQRPQRLRRRLRRRRPRALLWSTSTASAAGTASSPTTS